VYSYCHTPPVSSEIVQQCVNCLALSLWQQTLNHNKHSYNYAIHAHFLVHKHNSMYASHHAVFDTLRLIVDTPAKVFTLLGESLPNVCGYFCIYMVIKFMSGLLIEMTRMISLLQHYVLAVVWSSQTARDKRAVVMGLRHYDDAGWFAYPKYISQDLLVVVITFTFCCKYHHYLNQLLLC
jgi:Calcium-dependent channel, 7TM region, putative phosphate